MRNQRVKIAARIARQPKDRNVILADIRRQGRKTILISSFLLAVSFLFLLAAYANDNFFLYRYMYQPTEAHRHHRDFKEGLRELNSDHLVEPIVFSAWHERDGNPKDILVRIAKLQSVLSAVQLGQDAIQDVQYTDEGVYVTFGTQLVEINDDMDDAEKFASSLKALRLHEDAKLRNVEFGDGHTLLSLEYHEQQAEFSNKSVDEMIQDTWDQIKALEQELESVVAEESHGTDLTRAEQRFDSLFERLTNVLAPREKGQAIVEDGKTIGLNDMSTKLFQMYLAFLARMGVETTKFDYVAEDTDDSRFESLMKAFNIDLGEQVKYSYAASDGLAVDEDESESKSSEAAEEEGPKNADDGFLTRTKRGMDYHKYFTTGGGPLQRDESGTPVEYNSQQPDTIGDMNTVPGYMRFRVRPPGSPLKYTDDKPFLTENMKCVLAGLAFFVVGAIGSALFFCKPEEEYRREKEECLAKTDGKERSDGPLGDDTTEGEPEPTDQDVDSALME